MRRESDFFPSNIRLQVFSTSGLRYEGVLATLSEAEKVIALRDVTCFGTEDRRKDTFVAPSPKLLPQVVFRRGEIAEVRGLERFQASATQGPSRSEPPALHEEPSFCLEKQPAEVAPVTQDFFDSMSTSVGTGRESADARFINHVNSETFGNARGRGGFGSRGGPRGRGSFVPRHERPYPPQEPQYVLKRSAF